MPPHSSFIPCSSINLFLANKTDKRWLICGCVCRQEENGYLFHIPLSFFLFLVFFLFFVERGAWPEGFRISVLGSFSLIPDRYVHQTYVSLTHFSLSLTCLTVRKRVESRSDNRRGDPIHMRFSVGVSASKGLTIFMLPCA